MTGNPGRARVELLETEAAFEAVRQGLINAAIATPVEASVAREKLILAVQALDAVRAHLQNVVDTGEIEAMAAEIAANVAS